MKTDSILKLLRLALLAALASLILAGSYLHVMDSYELPTLDLRFRLRPTLPTTDKIALIEISDDTIAKIGSFPFDRSYHSIIVNALSEAGAKAIVFDLFFSEPSPADAEFEKAIKKAGSVYFPLVFELPSQKIVGIPQATGCAVKNLEGLNAGAKGMGHINVIPDVDGKYRRVPAHIQCSDGVYPYLGLKVACDYLGIPEGAAKIPLDEHSLMLINFSGAWDKTYKHYSYVDILQSYVAPLNKEEPTLDLKIFKDKVCIIGLTAVGTVDLHPNPFDPLYPAMGMHAEAFNSVINNSFLRRASREANLAVLIALCALISALVLKTKPLRGFFILFSAVTVYVLASILAFNHFGVWVDIIYPMLIVVFLHLSLTLYKYVKEWKHRLLMENELDIAKKIQESFLPKTAPAVEGIEVSACMFTARQVGGDLYDFATFSEDKFGIMIGDVSGKGVPAALFMAMVVGAFRSFALPGAKPEEVLARLNEKLVKESAHNLFVTVFYSIFDMKAKSFIYGNGGHLPVLYLPALTSATYAVATVGPQFLDVKEGAPLGLMDGPYTGGEIKFGKGDTFIFYTDGITEAMNQKSDMYGKERLQAAAEKNRALSAEKLAAAIEKDVRKFEPKSQQHDDITIIVVKIS